ncbi:hypothetical protein C0J52_09294 [Blattella germanica]|nr:hypothetical protein C0J52_09294 [Blattella germanica]
MLHIGLLGLLISFIIYVIYYCLLFTLLLHMYGSNYHSHPSIIQYMLLIFLLFRLGQYVGYLNIKYLLYIYMS